MGGSKGGRTQADGPPNRDLGLGESCFGDGVADDLDRGDHRSRLHPLPGRDRGQRDHRVNPVHRSNGIGRQLNNAWPGCMQIDPARRGDPGGQPLPRGIG